MKIRTGDTVVVISGKDKGKTGQVLKVLEAKRRVVVGDINMRTRHMRGSPQRPGQIIKYEAGISISNVMLIDAKTKKRTRVGFEVEKGNKKRVAKKSGEAILKTAVKTKKEAPKKEEKEASSSVPRSGGTTEDKKEAKEKSTKTKRSSPADAGKIAAPKERATSKQPFWKKMGFGAEAMESAEPEEGSHMKEDHSVPDQTQRSSNRGSTRGS